jgi:hypothetical protein
MAKTIVVGAADPSRTFTFYADEWNITNDGWLRMKNGDDSVAVLQPSAWTYVCDVEATLDPKTTENADPEAAARAISRPRAPRS